MPAKALGIIPARWGSTRFPGKPLHLIAGQPLLRHVWERCQRAQELSAVIIATDDMRIAEAAFGWGAEVALTSPKHRSGTDRAAEVVANCEGVRYVVNIQGDEPLIDPKLIDRLVQGLRADRGIEMVTAAHPFAKAEDVASPHQVKVVCDAQSHALYFSRAPIPYRNDAFPGVEDPRDLGGRRSAPVLRHQGIYGYTRDLLLRFVRWKPTPLERAESLEQLRALENGVRILVLVTKTGSPGIDTPEDAAALERQLAQGSRGQRPRLQRAARKIRRS